MRELSGASSIAEGPVVLVVAGLAGAMRASVVAEAALVVVLDKQHQAVRTVTESDPSCCSW